MPERQAYRVVSRLAAIALAATALAGCEDKFGSASGYRAYAPVPDDTLALIKQKGSSKNAPILIRAYKKEAELEIWKQKDDGRYVLLKTYPMCRWSGQLGPKVREGDRQVPEGFYSITPGQMNPNSAYYLSFNVGYPNAYDRAWGHTGGSIMVHGICSSAGCFSMTDKQIEEIYALARESFAGGQRAIQMESFPFRMTADNLAKYRLDPNMPFWRELKRGADYFDVTRTEPPVGVCNKHYVFGTPKNGARFDAFSPCPPLNDDAEVDAALAEKAVKDEAEVAALIPKTRPVRIVYQDGGQHPYFNNRFADVSRPEALVAAPVEIALDDAPKAKPAAVQVAGIKAAKAAVAARAAPQDVAPVTAAAAARNADTTGTVPAAFAAAPSAYATTEQKSATRAFFDKVLSFAGSGSKSPDEEAAPSTVPASEPAVPQPASVPLPPRRSAAMSGQKLPKAVTGGATLDPDYVAFAPVAATNGH